MVWRQNKKRIRIERLGALNVNIYTKQDVLQMYPRDGLAP